MVSKATEQHEEGSISKFCWKKGIGLKMQGKLFAVLVAIICAVNAVSAKDICATGDDKHYNMLGCYEEKNIASILLNERHLIDWYNIQSFMRRFACKCSKIAEKKGFAGFGLHYYGICVGKTKEQLKNLKSKSHQETKCVGDQTYTVCSIKKHEHCTGVAFAEAVYKFKTEEETNVNGGLGPWKPWTKCDKECGHGLMHRERNCDNPEPKGKGKDCSGLGPLSETRICKIKECPVDGGYSCWSEYSPCSKSCGRGSKNRTRKCDKPKPAHGGKDCSRLGPGSQTTACNIQHCPPVNGGFGAWASYGPCSKTCGAGTKTRSRPCNNPAPLNGGKNCSSLGPAKESKPCNIEMCYVISPSWGTGDGTGGTEEHIGSFKNKEECIERCLKKSRNGKKANGATVDSATGKSCYCEYGQTGRNTATSWINTYIRAQDGGYGAWGSYGTCSKSCGGGTKTRRRQCTNPAPARGGKDCSLLGSATESASCNTFSCPEFPTSWKTGDGTGGPEEHIGKVSNAAECAVKCFTRRKNGKLANGATVDTATQTSCYCEYGQTGRNSAKNWRNTFIRPQDGGYGAWGSYGTCSKTCGGGTKTRSRQCNNPAPARGGKDCSLLGSATESAPCNTFSCPEFPVNWARGDGQGGSEEHIGTVTNAAECVVKCYSRKRNGKFANGATIDSATQKSCYCEYGQTGRNSASNWKNTFIRPLDGGYGAWGSFGSCSRSCGGGTKTRSRPCNNPALMNGGKFCSRLGPSSETVPCNTERCPKYPAQWATGDGSGGSEEHIGTFKNKEECYMKCLTKMRNGKLANGVTVDAATGKSCYCEYGQTGRNGSGSWKNTFIKRS